MSILYLDIETIPCQRQGALEEIRESIKPPGNISKQETIDKWMAQNADTAAEEKWRKTALDGSVGEILCIGFAVDDAPAMTVGRWKEESEANVLHMFYQLTLNRGISNLSTIVGHNVKDFDLRFIYQRSVINDVEPTFPLHNGSRYSGERVFDTMIQWAGWGNRISLKNLCKALGIEAKTGDIDGANMWDAVLAERYDDIREYCKSDVEATREVYKRMTFGG